MKRMQQTIKNITVLSFIPFMLLAACSTEETVSTAGSHLASTGNVDVSIRAVSTKPWLITGGDVLLEVTSPESSAPSQLRVTLNGAEIGSQLVRISATRQQLLVTDLPAGDSQVQVSNGNSSQSLTLTNYPISGPVISGPHESPFVCQSDEFELATGELYGPPQDENCFRETRIDYVYWSAEDEIFKPYVLPFGSLPPEDIAQITDERGNLVPYIVRVETGVVNRGIYEIAMLHDPAASEPTPWNPSAGWNGKLVYTHGGGCRSGWYQQGDSTGGVLRNGLLVQGYAVVSSSLNVFGQNCNDLLASETHIMVKERFIEHYGEPVYTIATGVSGGSYQSQQTADNYPGVFDGVIVGLSFPDVTSATIFTLADSRLLHYYFNEINPEGFSEEEQRAISGFAVHASIPNLARGAARLDPIYEADIAPEEQGGEVSVSVLDSRRYDSTNQNGLRATVYDHTVNVYGRVPGTQIARRPLDNVGVQYGLAAYNAGVITTQQFIDLNRGIGGFDRDLNHVPERHRADSDATKRAVESGRILFGGAGLAATPVIDYRSYMDLRENGDIHMLVHQFSTRQRLIEANGHADNQVMQIGGRWGYTEEEPDLGQLFREMDNWILAIQGDRSESSQADKVVNNRPLSLTDACWDNRADERVKIEQRQTFAGTGLCNELYPAFP
ncbi:MAG: tannase/feruloyl esterase family alpha/beta hydrolase, partial [Pseudomonadales bacterium]|nr:tannase/feruloyl esterase family alpha/beta hydrolase [Pseudomonadales bacterium]